MRKKPWRCFEMGRSFASVRMGVCTITERWERTVKRLRRDDRISGDELTGFAKCHSSEAFFGCDNPLEAVVFSALIEIQREQED